MYAQRQRVRPQLHGRCPQGLRGLQRVAPLYPLPTSLTAADRNVEPPPEGLAYDLLLILSLDLFHLQGSRAAGVGTVLRHRHRDDLVDLLGNLLAVVLAMRLPRLASRPLRLLLPLPTREGRRRSLRRPLRFFQLTLELLNLFPQPLPLALQPLPLALQPLPLALQPLPLLLPPLLFFLPPLLLPTELRDFLLQPLILLSPPAPLLPPSRDLLPPPLPNARRVEGSLPGHRLLSPFPK